MGTEANDFHAQMDTERTQREKLLEASPQASVTWKERTWEPWHKMPIMTERKLFSVLTNDRTRRGS